VNNCKLLENLSLSSGNSSRERTRQKFKDMQENHSKNALSNLLETSKDEQNPP